MVRLEDARARRTPIAVFLTDEGSSRGSRFNSGRGHIWGKGEKMKTYYLRRVWSDGYCIDAFLEEDSSGNGEWVNRVDFSELLSEALQSLDGAIDFFRRQDPPDIEKALNHLDAAYTAIDEMKEASGSSVAR